MNRQIRLLSRYAPIFVLTVGILLAQQTTLGGQLAAPAYRVTQAAMSELDLNFTVLGNVKDYFVTITTLRKTIQQLELRERELSAQLITLRSVQMENNTLRAAFASSDRHQRDWVIASLSQTAGRTTLDVGSSVGIKTPTSVLAQGNFVGKVVQVGIETATVSLINEPNTSWGVTLARTAKPGVLTTQAGVTSVEFLERLDDIHTGDAIVTLGDDGIDPGLPVGTVTAIRTRISDAVTKVEVQPTGLPLLTPTVFVAKRKVI